MDMLLTVQQIQEKSHEEQDLYQVFIDLIKAFCTENKIMPKSLRHLGCPCHCANIIQLFYNDMQIVINIGGLLLEPNKLQNGGKKYDHVVHDLLVHDLLVHDLVVPT